MTYQRHLVDLSRARWYKSSRSNGGEGGCVEVADNLPGLVAVRDSKDPDGPVLTFAAVAWRGFVEGVKDERFGL
ncbi:MULTISPECIES: DUF397 domain-containing protein [unclassified Spirillospora]|uniref:DUF397 domain-containing protein n=1 Tax=unclassified Spirillospora TaxID=2642701 RepID=UPI00371DF99A